MKFSIVGTGNVAWLLAQKLVLGSHQCNFVYGRDIEKATQLAEAVNGRATDNIREIKEDSDAIIIAVSDDAIAEVSQALGETSAVLIHTAGSIAIDALGSNDHQAVIWPIYSIVKNQLPAHRDIPCAYEASSSRAKSATENLIHSFSDKAYYAGFEQRQWMHLSAVMTNNFSNHLAAITQAIAKEQGFDSEFLKPIQELTFEKIMSSSATAEIQTGPASRNDAVTIERHEQLLAVHPEWQKVYEAMTASIQAMMK